MASKKSESPMDAASLNKKTLAQLKKLCTSLGVTCKGTKAQHIDAILMAKAASEGIVEMELPKKKKSAKSPSLVLEIPTASPRSRSKSPKRGRAKTAKKAKSKSPKRASPVKAAKKTAAKKAVTKKVTAKKSPVKKSPVKKAKTAKKAVAKKSPVKKAKTCVDKEDPLICDEGQICSAPSGRCVKDTKINRHGSKNDKAELLVDGRVIVGTVSTIQKLEKILGGTITLPGKPPAKKAKSPAKKKKSPARAKSPVKKASPAKKKKSPVKAKSPAKRTSPKGKEELSPPTPKPKSPKKSPVVKKPARKPAKSPQTLEAVQRRLDKLVEEGGDQSDIEKLQKKLDDLKKKKKSPEAKAKPGKVKMAEQEIYKTFMECLSALSAE